MENEGMLVFLKEFMSKGGIFMWIILINWLTGIGISIYKP